MDRRIRISALLVAAFAVVADQATKGWALAALRSVGGHLTLPGPVDLTLSFNQSNAFGLTPVVGQATRWLLMSANFAVAAILLYVIVAKPVRPLTRFGLALILAGAVGNGLDRLWIGAVVDFLDASKIGFGWIFNLADATLDAGIGLLMLSAWREARRTAT
ncbi:MAG: signal peptidase II [Alphaproteobacteria bacterium]|nr:signal peptidase II [Alphaproteobacteria bacterium]